nr:MAG TPA: hypothetical protein [Caudoviricetes sp.]
MGVARAGCRTPARAFVCAGDWEPSVIPSW